MTITTRISTFFNGKLVGQDALGNRYYQERGKAPKHRRQKRWVIYKGAAEPSTIPPEWHGWMHYTTNTPPTEQKREAYSWEKAPKANMTGTTEAYVPPGHLLRGGQRSPTTSDYQPWTPS